MRLPWGGDDAATTAGDAHEDDGASSNGASVDDKHLRVVLDLGMQDLMCDAEIKSTVTQLQCSYASVLNLAVDAVIARNANRRDTRYAPTIRHALHSAATQTKSGSKDDRSRGSGMRTAAATLRVTSREDRNGVGEGRRERAVAGDHEPTAFRGRR
jgi:hypothetical protein